MTDIAFTSDFCDNQSHPASSASLFLTFPRPRPTRPRVPYLMSWSSSSRVPKSQVPAHASHVPCPSSLVVPLLYTAFCFCLFNQCKVLHCRWLTVLGCLISPKCLLDLHNSKRFSLCPWMWLFPARFCYAGPSSLPFAAGCLNSHG